MLVPRFGSPSSRRESNFAAPATVYVASVAEITAEPQKESMTITASTRREHTEGQVARSIEEQTAKMPSDTFLWAAVGAMAVSASFHMMGKKDASVFVGQWAPTLLILGVYNKLVKQLGSDFTDSRVRA